MTDIIKLARKVWGESAILPFAELERFAELVAAQEREACAKVCEAEDVAPTDDAVGVQSCIADAIRARAKEQT